MIKHEYEIHIYDLSQPCGNRQKHIHVFVFLFPFVFFLLLIHLDFVMIVQEYTNFVMFTGLSSVLYLIFIICCG